MFKIKKSHIYMECAVLVGFAALLIAYSNVTVKLAASIFVVFIARDIYRMLGTTYELTEKGIQVKVRDNIREDRLWKDMDYVTRSRKNTRIVALVFDKEIITIPPYVEGFEELIQTLFKFNKTNKHIGVHDSIPGAFNLDITLKENGKMKIK